METKFVKNMLGLKNTNVLVPSYILLNYKLKWDFFLSAQIPVVLVLVTIYFLKDYMLLTYESLRGYCQ